MSELDFHRYGGGYFIADLNITSRWGIFAQLVGSSRAPKTVENYIGLGATCALNKHHLFGLAVAHVGDYQERYVSETVLEWFYKLKIGKHIEIQPDMQYIITPAGKAKKDALALFLQLMVHL